MTGTAKRTNIGHQGSLGLWIPDSNYWIPDLFQWNLGFRIPQVKIFKIPDSTAKIFRIPLHGAKTAENSSGAV